MPEYLYFLFLFFFSYFAFCIVLGCSHSGFGLSSGITPGPAVKGSGMSHMQGKCLSFCTITPALLSILNKLNFTMPWGFACCGFWLILNRELEKRCDSSSSWETMSLCSGMGVSLCGSQQRKKCLQGRVGLKTLREPCRNHCQVFLWKCGGRQWGAEVLEIIKNVVGGCGE